MAGTATTVSRGMRIIDTGYLDGGDVDGLAALLGIRSRHLSRLFMKHVGASPHKVAATRWVQNAKILLSDKAVPISEIAFAAGFRSIHRFNDAFSKTYGRPPGSYLARKARDAAGALRY